MKNIIEYQYGLSEFRAQLDHGHIKLYIRERNSFRLYFQFYSDAKTASTIHPAYLDACYGPIHLTERSK